MKTNFSLLFYMKKPKTYKFGPAPIYMRITVNGKRSETATGRLCEPGRWNASAGRANGTKEEIRSFNAYLDDLQKKVYEIHRQLSETGAEITAESLKNRLSGKAEKSITLMQVFKDHNRKVRALMGKDFAAGTIERYETSLKHTQNYLKWKYQTDDIDVKKIDHEFITNYDFYLRSERKCANNSTVKYLKNFKKIIRICIASGWIDKDPFLNYKVKLKRVDRVFLSQEELDTISDKEFSSERLRQVRDIFLFCCYTGLAYADIKKLRRNEIDKGIDGEMWM
jgi:predicted RNase H-like nuclease (RuvC/YqgF family)